MKKLLSVLFFISLITPSFLQAAPIPMVTAGCEDFYSQSGIQSSGDLRTMEVGQTTFGTVMDAAKLSKFGIKETRVGDKVHLTLLKDGRLKISIMSVKQEKLIQLKK
ncbi:MAG: hypothetical protein K8S13_24600 [Desulfobacula sp.]|uniref:hypothetical protein n=1 Tax=Desulfobacula sp. TaxID=2593537 RepID=UPI0025BEC138|nr:hypothetical protein [Desulfobacula sp.]MCD4723010.1 hypothetical protein [Desulfobacula sp.]